LPIVLLKINRFFSEQQMLWHVLHLGDEI